MENITRHLYDDLSHIREHVQNAERERDAIQREIKTMRKEIVWLMDRFKADASKAEKKIHKHIQKKYGKA